MTLNTPSKTTNQARENHALSEAKERTKPCRRPYATVGPRKAHGCRGGGTQPITRGRPLFNQQREIKERKNYPSSHPRTPKTRKLTRLELQNEKHPPKTNTTRRIAPGYIAGGRSILQPRGPLLRLSISFPSVHSSSSHSHRDDVTSTIPNTTSFLQFSSDSRRRAG